jgi:hypothetical protein
MISPRQMSHYQALFEQMNISRPAENIDRKTGMAFQAAAPPRSAIAATEKPKLPAYMFWQPGCLGGDPRLSVPTSRWVWPYHEWTFLSAERTLPWV